MRPASASSFADLYDFPGGTGGANPYGSLLLVGDTLLWGTSSLGGTTSYGNVFCIKTDGSGYFDAIDFNGTNGAAPYGSLTYSHGHLFGTCFGGGFYNYGCLFVLNPTTLAYDTLYSFDGINGGEPFGSLIASGDTLIGMSSENGTGYGNVFDYVIGSGYQDLYEFSGTDGQAPNGDLTLSGGKLYGMTSTGGAYNEGNIFSMQPNGTGYVNLFDFNMANGAFPYGSLAFLNSGNKFFGMASQGGSNGDGVIFNYDILIVNGFKIVNVTCTRGSTGSASAIPEGGTSPYSYSWNPGGSSNETITGLSIGSYTVTVTDFSGSTATAVAVISGVQIAVTKIIDVSCYGGQNGSLQAGLSGGTAPYAFLWSDGTQGPLDRGLSAGTYTVTVSDSCGMSATASATITQPILLTVTDSVTANVHCPGTSTGSILATVTGGTTPYTYLWSDATSQTTASATGLSAGTYYINITDANGCTAIDSATVTQPSKPALGVSIARARNIGCSGGTDGMAAAIPTGGTPPVYLRLEPRRSNYLHNFRAECWSLYRAND